MITDYIDQNNGTVLDIKNNLIWIQSSLDQKMTWIDAIDYAKNLNFAGYQDWRLPTKEELQEFAKIIVNNKELSCLLFEYIASSYWSSTTNASYSNYAWGVNFGNGYVNNGSKTSLMYVRCVRGGQC